MKALFIETKYKDNLTSLLKNIKLDKKIGLTSTSPFLNQLPKIKKYLEKNKVKTIIAGEILGCDVNNAIKIKNKVNSFLFIGSAYFHPIEIFRKTKKPVTILNPFSKKISKVSKKDLEKYEKRRKGKLIKFLSATKIGILVSTKPGQLNLKKALELKNKIKKPCFIFLTNEIDENKLENFPDIDFWVNSACPRIEGKNIINLEEIGKI